MSWFTFLHLEKMELCFVLFCFVLLVTEVKVFYLNDPPFCFWYRNIDMSNFCVGLVGGGRDGWGELRSEPRAAHVFFIFQIKKELFIFIFQIKSISKGTKWQSLVNSPSSLVVSRVSLCTREPEQQVPPCQGVQLARFWRIRWQERQMGGHQCHQVPKLQSKQLGDSRPAEEDGAG